MIFSTSSMEIAALTITQLERQQLSTMLLGPEVGDAVEQKVSNPESKFISGSWIRPQMDLTFESEFTAWKGNKPLKYTDTGYNALIALSQAVNAVGMEPERIKGYFENGRPSQGVVGDIVFDRNHDVIGSGYEIVEIIRKKP